MNYFNVRNQDTISSNEKAALTQVEAREDRYMALDIEPHSASSLALADYLASSVHRRSGKRYKVTVELTRAVGAMLGDLIVNASESIDRYGFRPMGLSTFSGMTVGYKPFKAVVGAMESLGLLEVITGERGSLTGRTKVREATRFRAKPSLFEQALRYGVTPGNWSFHFRQMPRQARIAHPILLRSCSTKKRSESSYFETHKLPGAAMKVEMSLPIVQVMTKQVHDINRFMATQDLFLGKAVHRYFQRIFGQGDTIGKNFTKGGRLYSPGKDSYQQLSSEERAYIRINGEPTVEVDIGSSFLTIFRVLTSVSFDPQEDAYAGVVGLPRGVAKSWVVMTLGHDRFHTMWPAQAKARYRRNRDRYGTEEFGTGDLQRDHPIGRTHKAMLAALPELHGWPDSSIRWGDLQYVESCAVLEAVHTLAVQHGIAALPVHDSIRVPVSAQGLAAHVLSDAFYKHVGVRPVIKAK